MGQGEDTEKEISFQCLRTLVEEAIKTKNICIIERIEKENLRYAQKYAELLVSKSESETSFYSLFIGRFSLSAVLFTIGVSLFLTGASVPKEVFTVSGVLVMIFGIWAMLEELKKGKELEKAKKDVEFMHTIILKIEEMLSNFGEKHDS